MADLGIGKFSIAGHMTLHVTTDGLGLNESGTIPNGGRLVEMKFVDYMPVHDREYVYQ